MNKEELIKKMWDMNYNIDSIDLASDMLYFINEELEDKPELDLEDILDSIGIFHKQQYKKSYFEVINKN